jgi:hypothetical protein
MEQLSKDSIIKFGSWDWLCLLWGTLGQVAYLGDLLKPHFHAYFAVLLFIILVSLCIFIQPGDFANKWVTRCHLFAALWYAIITTIAEILSLTGHAPEGTNFFRILMHLGWIPCFRIMRKAYSDK